MTVQEWLGADNTLSIDIWKNKYRYQDETFDEWLDRITGKDDELKQKIIEKKFLFGGRTLASRNTGNGMSFSNCYSSGYVPDSIEGIMELNKNLALTYQASGGQGLSLSLVRPKGAPVRGGVFKSDGIVPFMEIFNQTTASISQGGSRKGALLMSLSIWHPEIETFISIKDGTNKITKANLSVEIDDDFMNLVKNGVTEYKYVHSLFGEEYTINPVDLYNKIMKKAWSSAEPGVIFTNRFRNYNLMELHDEYKIVTGNPCGEQPLPKDGACNLGSINLAAYVVDPFTENVQFNFDEFDKDIKLFVKALDDVLNEGMNLHALKTQREMAKNYRNIGLGIMGYATMLMSMGIEYGSYDAKLLTDNIMSVMINSAATASAYLAQLNGAFPKYNNKIIEGKFYHKALNGDTMDLIKQYGLRNCSLLSVAPSGSIGTMLNVSTGLEPYYALTYQRKTESLHGDKDVYYTVEVDTAKKAREAYGDDVCVSAMDIDWHDRVEVQGIMQKYVDTAISSTVNVPEETTIEQLRDLYLFAWEKGLKGITIYREGSFEAILSTKDKKEKAIKEEVPRGVMDKVPADTIYIPRDMINGCGRAKVMIGFSPSENRVTDIYYIAKGQGGCSKNIQGEAILISQVLRLGGNLADIQKSFLGIDACSSCTLARTRGVEISGKNCPNILLKMVLDLQQEMQRDTIQVPKVENKKNNDTIKTQTNVDKKMVCPECGATLTPIGGCYTCNECGFSKCD